MTTRAALRNSSLLLHLHSCCCVAPSTSSVRRPHQADRLLHPLTPSNDQLTPVSCNVQPNVSSTRVRAFSFRESSKRSSLRSFPGKKTQLKEYEQSAKTLIFVDKRIGENDEGLGEFDKAILRSKRERQVSFQSSLYGQSFDFYDHV